MVSQPELIMEKVQSSFPLIMGVVNGSVKGHVYHLPDSNGGTFVISNAGFSQYLPSLAGNTTRFFEFVSTAASIPGYFHVYDATAQQSDELQSLGWKTWLRERYQLRPTGSIQPTASLPKQFRIVSCARVDFASFSVFNLDLANKFWTNQGDFQTKSLGQCVVDGNGSPVCLCYAAGIAEGLAEIDIATLNEYRGMGLAKAALEAFMIACRENDLTPNWDCFVSNAASLKLALSMGFRTVKNYNLLSILTQPEK